MGTKRFGILAAAGFMGLGAFLMAGEKDSPGSTVQHAGEVKDVGINMTAEVGAAIPEVQQAVAPAIQSVGGLVSGATAAAGGQATADPATGGSSAADGGGGGAQP